jgi:predicted phosphodiesterase
MKIAIASDVHLEFGDLDIKNTKNAETLILSGDICVASDITQRDPYDTMGPDYRSNRYHDFFQRCAANFKNVIYIAGNHEHYHGDFAKTIPHLKEVLAYLPNLHVLDKETITIDDVVFIGGTLWTDMNNNCPETLQQIKHMMNDFSCVKNSNEIVHFKAKIAKKKPVDVTDEEWFATDISKRTDTVSETREGKFSPVDALADHREMMAYLQHVLDQHAASKVVVVGHHAPSKLSTHPRYAHQHIMNGGYSSCLDDFVLDHPQIKLWTHGHTHETHDYMIGSTRIVCNPRGYVGHEQQANEWELQYVQV